MKAQLHILCASLLFAAGIATAQDVAVRGDVIYPVTAPPIENGVIVIENGKIAAIGPAGDVAVPEGLEVVEAAVITPGLIDAHSVIGLAGWLNQDMAQDQIEHTAAIQPEQIGRAHV